MGHEKVTESGHFGNMSNTPALSHGVFPRSSLGLDLGWRLYPTYGAWRTSIEPALVSSRSPRLSRGGHWPDAAGDRAQAWATRLSGRLHVERRTAQCHVDLQAVPGHGRPLAGVGTPRDLTFGLRAALSGSPTLGYTGRGLLTLGAVTDSAELHLRPSTVLDDDQRIGLELLVGIKADRRAFQLASRSRFGRGPGDLMLALHCRFVPDSSEWSQAA